MGVYLGCHGGIFSATCFTTLSEKYYYAYFAYFLFVIRNATSAQIAIVENVIANQLGILTTKRLIKIVPDVNPNPKINNHKFFLFNFHIPFTRTNIIFL